MTLDKKLFYDSVEPSLFKGGLSVLQIEGMGAILNEWFSSIYTDMRWLAYELATIYHETGTEMQPIKERGGEKYLKSKPYYPYYGRDFCQTTWKDNYEKVKAFTGVDVVTNPDLIANVEISAKVALYFMVKGLYTGAKLGNYFNEAKEDAVNARRVINGIDKAQLIAGYYRKFKSALNIS